MAAVTFIGLDEVRRLLAAFPQRLFAAANTAVSKTTFAVQRRIAAGFNAPGGIQSRSGELARSMTPEVSGSTTATLRGSVYTTKLYAPIQEYGGVVTAKNKYTRVPGGPYLNIPLPANKTAAGVQRMSARDVFAAGGHLQRSKAGNWLVMLGGQPMFVLRRQVTIPARLGMGKAAEAEVPTLLSSLGDELKAQLAAPA